MKQFFTYILFFCCLIFYSQTNCNAFKLEGKELKFKACKEVEKTKDFYQFQKEYQEILDNAIKIDPTYDYAYWAKSIAYLKSGDFLTWKKLIDKAVALNPKYHLGYRGWCRYQFFKDYKGAIKDIEAFEKLLKGNIGYCQNGNYHLKIAKAICYSAIGQKDKAIEIIENYLSQNNNEPDLFNFYHLGILYYKKSDFVKALECFKKQVISNNLAENTYYLALCHKKLKRVTNYKENILKAKELYINGYKMDDPYAAQYDKVYLSEIEEEIKKSKN